ncbi:MAG: response regulator [Planctomycetes bacterium]|nr:response regulator [Planctomycetota bacterium]
MRRHIALAIHSDPKIARNLKDAFASLDHEYVWVRSQQAARALLAENDYCCIFIDLEIPARSRGGIPSIDNGLNLLEQIRAIERLRNVPIVATVRLCEAKPRLVARAMRYGATDFIEKPFAITGDTLCRVLKKALDQAHALWRQTPAVNPTPSPEPVPFKGGEMLFYPSRVELCGVKIVGDTGAGYSRMILDLLKHTRNDDRCAHISGEAMAARIGADGGVGTVTGCVRTLRQNITARLREHLNVICGRDDVIANDGLHGYRLREWIIVLDATDDFTGSTSGAGPAARRDAREPVSGPVGARVTDPVGERVSGPVSEPVTERQRQVLDVLASGDGLRVPAIAAKMKAAPGTVKRELTHLKGRGLVAFEGPPRSGRYRLTGAKQR